MKTQAETAEWMGYGADVDAMNRDHDRLHAAFCKWMGITSHALRVANNENVNHEDYTLANYEEDAVLAIQRVMRMNGVGVPE